MCRGRMRGQTMPESYARNWPDVQASWGDALNPGNVPMPVTHGEQFQAMGPASAKSLLWLSDLTRDAQPDTIGILFGAGYRSLHDLSQHAVSWAIYTVQEYHFEQNQIVKKQMGRILRAREKAVPTWVD